MGWSCQYDYKGHCKLVHKPCEPGMKGCTLAGDFIFSTKPHADEKKENKDEEIDFSALAKSN